MNLTAVENQYKDVYKKFGGVRNCTIICCGDHGVAEENVSAYPKATTEQMVRNYLVSQGAAANAFANFARSELIVVDVGVDADLKGLKNIVNRKIARGTKNFTKEMAMTVDQAFESINIGSEVVKTAVEAGFNCFLPGEMGIGNTTSSAAIASLMLDLPPEKVTGRGTNISDERFKHKIEIVKKAIKLHKKLVYQKDKPNCRALEILTKVGGFEIGCMAGVIIGAWQNHSLAIIDGFNSAVAALIACAIVPKCRSNIIASQIAREPGHKFVLDALELEPVLNLNLALGEAIGSSIVARTLYKFVSSSYFEEDIEDDEEYDNNDDDDGNFNDIDFDGNEEYDDDDEDDLNFELEFDEDDDDDDDEDVDVTLNIYEGAGSDNRFNTENDEDEFYIEFKRMDEDNISVTDRTFNFYLNTMPVIDKASMDRCKKRIDNLSKPYGSLGLLEEIVIQIAGISTDESPNSNLKTNIICFTDKKDDFEEFEECYEEGEEPDIDNSLLDISDTAEAFDVDITFSLVDNDKDSTTAFDFGRITAEDVSFKVPIIGISIISMSGAPQHGDYEDISTDFEETLLTEDGKLKYKADEFLKYIPKNRRNLVSAVIGAIIAAAHNSSLVIVDAGAVDVIARYIKQLCPAVQPYILQASKLIAHSPDDTDDELDGEAVCIAVETVRAALYGISEMKSFKDTGVDYAIDGVGSIHQFN